MTAIADAMDLRAAALTAWPADCDRATNRLIAGAILSLDDAIKNAEELAEGVHWSAVYPGLDLGPEPEFEARQQAARNLADASKGVRDVLGTHLHDPHGLPEKAKAA